MNQGFLSKVNVPQVRNGIVSTAILMTLMFPFVVFGYKFPDMGFLAWVHLVPLTLVIHRYSFKRKVLFSFLSLMLAHYGIFYWLLIAMQGYGGLNFFAAFGSMTLLFIVLSLVGALCLSFSSWVNHLVKLPFFILLPVFMTTKDFLFHIIPFQGFPWETVAYTQGAWIHLFQWVDTTGVFGLCFFIYLINGLFVDGIKLFLFRKQVDKMVSRLLVVFVLLMVSLYLSFLSGEKFEKDKKILEAKTIAMTQGNIPQDTKWNPYKAQEHLGEYLELTAKSVKDGADIVIWPETAYPYSLNLNKIKEERFLDKDGLSVPILFGAITENRTAKKRHLYNSVVLAETTAQFQNVYHKMHLVPFGEYLPMKEIFGYLDKLTSEVGAMDAGSEYVIFDLGYFTVGPLICFEDIFPGIARQFARRGSQVLVNFTNDAWYGKSSAQLQHVVFSQFRALENRRFLFRSTNNGQTAIINPKGLIVDKIEPYEKSYLLKNVQIEYADGYFTLYGDFWKYGVVGLAVFLLIYAFFKKRLGPVKLEF